MYKVLVKYNRKKRIIKVHPTMSWIEFIAICKHEFDIAYTMFFTIGGERRVDVGFQNLQTHNRIEFENKDKIGISLKDIDVYLLLFL